MEKIARTYMLLSTIPEESGNRIANNLGGAFTSEQVDGVGPRVRFSFQSADVSVAQEIGAWIRTSSKTLPVPFDAHFRAHDDKLVFSWDVDSQTRRVATIEKGSINIIDLEVHRQSSQNVA